MKKISRFNAVLTAFNAVVLLLLLTSFIQSSTKTNKPAGTLTGNLPNGASLYHMGIDARYTYYIYVPETGAWSFERAPLEKAKDAAWVK